MYHMIIRQIRLESELKLGSIEDGRSIGEDGSPRGVFVW